MKLRRSRPLSMLLLLIWAGQAWATGFDQLPTCPDYELSRAQRRSLDKKVHAETGLHVDQTLSSTCSQGRYVSAYGATRLAANPDGSEHWYVVDCSFDREAGWDCRYIVQRILRVRGRWRDGDATIFISPDVDAVLARKRLDGALALSANLSEQNACEPGEGVPQQFLELRSDLAYSFSVSQLSMNDERFTLWTTRYAIHFSIETAGVGLLPRCWRPRKQFECFTSSCPP